MKRQKTAHCLDIFKREIFWLHSKSEAKCPKVIQSYIKKRKNN